MQNILIRYHMSTGCRQKEFPGPSLNGENERLDFKNNFQRWNFSFMKKVIIIIQLKKLHYFRDNMHFWS